MSGIFGEYLVLLTFERRKSTLGAECAECAECIEKNLTAAPDFTRPFLHAVTAWCRGFEQWRESR